MVTAKMVKELREKTGAGMMDCKKALTQTNGDMDKAVEFLREKGLASAAKKAGRIAAEGLVTTYISEDEKTAVILEVNCETDFVAVNESFIEFTNNVAKQIATTDVDTVEELVDAKFIGDESVTVKDALTALIAKIGENMNVRRFEKLTIENGVINSYIHAGGKIGVAVALTCEKASDVLTALAKDIAMQVAAANPLFLDENSVDQEVLNKEREIYKAQALNEGKPEKIVEKMVEGRIKKYLKEVCLIDQVWVRNSDYTIKKLLDEKSKEVGSPITLSKFVRYERGEGLEKKEENFAEEVQKQMEKK
ncbi:translation elongation factor Ts [Clostridium ganghwense]|uniref:Elongation factor Ts n=1 Tax=Clostridium ganghwense TaxID=312089 RepID=A0ABT4CTX3_9CLOT|nr:translation elongation factor Ts [Clostridium ganghwense]MCY6372504.1 translation elongation factor Ts [Clostridium ganghwense]